MLPETATVAPWLDGEAWVLGSGISRMASAYRSIRARAWTRSRLWRGTGCGCAAGSSSSSICWPSRWRPWPPADSQPRSPFTTAPTRTTRCAARSISRCSGAIASGLADAGVVVEALSFENGVGQLELNIHYDDALRPPTRPFMAKQAIRAIAARNGMTATFMAKPQACEPGSSCHIHLSLWSPDGSTSAFESGAAGASASSRAVPRRPPRHAPCGHGVCLPNANSYARLVPDTLAPVRCDWAAENRAVALRTIGARRASRGRAPSARRRREPYLALAALVAGILIGIEDDLRPPPGGGPHAAAHSRHAGVRPTTALVADGRLRERLGAASSRCRR